MPFQHALSSRSGIDCVPRVFRSLMELDARKTLLSMDGIGAFDHIKRKAMMEALHTNPELASLFPFVRLFHGKNSKYVWYDDDGLSHEICQGEGGEQGDPLMPSFFALGQHAALVQVNATLREGEMLFANLDDIYVLCDPDRIAEIFVQIRHALFHQTGKSTSAKPMKWLADKDGSHLQLLSRIPAVQDAQSAWLLL